MREILDLNEFFVEGADLNSSHVLLHIREPGTPAEDKKGYFFALVEINNGLIGQIQKMQEIIDSIEKEYYDTNSQLTIDKRFEFALEHANKLSHHILNDEETNVNCVVGIIRGTSIHLSYHGDINALVFYPKGEGLAHINIFEQPNTHTSQLFSSIIEGTIGKKDTLYITTPHIKKYLENTRIEKMLISRNKKQTIAYIKNVLDSLQCQYSFGGFFANRNTKASTINFYNEPTNKKKKKNIQKVQAAFTNTTQTTTKPKKINTIQKHKPRTTNYRPRINKEQSTIVNIILIGLGKGILKIFQLLFLFFKFLFIGIGKAFVILFILITNKGNQRQIIKDKTLHWIQHKKNIFTEMPLFSKIILFTTILLGCIFIGSIFIRQHNIQTEHTKQEINNTLLAIHDKKDAANAKLLYDNESDALVLLQEAKNLIQLLPDDFYQDETNKEQLTQEVNIILKKLQKIETIEPEHIAEISAIKLARQKDNILAFGKDKTLYNINSLTKTVETQKHNSIPNLLYSTTPKSQDFILFASGDRSIALYNDQDKSLVSKDIIFTEETTAIAAMFIYNTRLYTLDRNTNQIYKHNKTLSGYDKGSSWLKDNSNVSQGISFAIDGDLYLLNEHGSIQKFTSGREQTFEIKNIEPILSEPTAIWTYTDINEIFILDPKEKRIVIIDKTGKLIKQITTNEWKNPDSMVIIPEDQSIYVIDSDNLYKVQY
jgi:hypothetical protein